MPIHNTDRVSVSVADPGCLSRIRIFSIQDPRSELFHPGSALKNLSILNPPKNCFSALGIMIRVVHPGSQIRILIFCTSRIPDLGIQKGPDPGSRIRIRNTGFGRNNADPQRRSIDTHSVAMSRESKYRPFNRSPAVRRAAAVAVSPSIPTWAISTPSTRSTSASTRRTT
jgi:hypothetical protein